MKLLFTNDWIRQKIASTPDDDPLAGPDIAGDDHVGNVSVIGDRKVVQLRMALGVLVRQLRLKHGLSIAELAQKADVPEDQLRQVEHDPHYTARPRLIHQLSTFFDVSLADLHQMSGATHAVNRSLYNAAIKYAAYSDDVSCLTDEERKALDEFVALLNERAKA